MLTFACAHCNQKLQVADAYAGKPVRCSLCNHVMLSPAPAKVGAGSDATVGLPQLEGQPSSLALAGLTGGVTLGMAGSASNHPTVKDNPARRSLSQVLADSGTEGERYRVLNEIARGGMGAVLRAADCDIRREVAVKYLLDQSDPRKKARFVEEAQITGQLEHPNIVPIHELGIDAHKRLFFSMKMVRGRSLQQVLTDLRDYPRATEKEFTLVRLLTIFVNTCHALSYAHSRGVVHRDLKPANIMVGDFGEVYVMDWGLAKIVDRNGNQPKSSSVIDKTPSFTWAEGSAGGSTGGSVKTSRANSGDQTIDGTVVGTPLYMPPEQARGDLAAIDARSDVYSLGAILYEMLTLQPPIEKGGGHVAILLRVSEGNIVPPRERVPDRARSGNVPSELAAIAMKALARAPERRYQTVEEMRRDIERFQEGRSVSAKEDTKWEVMKKLAQRNRGFTAAASAAAVLLVVMMLASSWINYRARVRAENNYAAYLQEQEDKRAQARKSVPAFVAAARLSADQKQFDDAIAQVSAALDYDPDYAPARLLKGQLLVANKDFSKAAKELELYLQLKSDDTLTAQLARLCATGKPDDPVAISQAADILIKQHRPTLAEGLVQAPDKLLAIYQQKIDAAWPGRGANLAMDGNGNLSLSLANYPEVLDLTPLQGMPLRSLSLANLKIRDLLPIKRMPLTYLSVQNCPLITDLLPLKGMKLKDLYLLNCGSINDFTVLRGMLLTRLQLTGAFRDKGLRMLRDMPLTELTLQNAEITDLEPLKGKQLTALSLSNCPELADLSALRGMPLASLSLVQCNLISDLSPLREMPLTSLVLQQCPLIQDLTPLSRMRLVTLSLHGAGQITDLSPLKGMPITQLTLNSCVRITDLAPLRGMPLTTLDATYLSGVKDLSPLLKAPLTQLQLTGCKEIRDLTPLQSFPLTTLGLGSMEQIKDLSFLQGSRLSQLTLDGCVHLRDISALKDVPLTHLRLVGCEELTDLSPLENMKLVYLHFPARSAKKGVDALRKKDTLTSINDFQAAVFWKKYDAGEFNK